jgi:hypothetical protein
MGCNKIQVFLTSARKASLGAAADRNLQLAGHE